MLIHIQPVTHSVAERFRIINTKIKEEVKNEIYRQSMRQRNPPHLRHNQDRNVDDRINSLMIAYHLLCVAVGQAIDFYDKHSSLQDDNKVKCEPGAEESVEFLYVAVPKETPRVFCWRMFSSQQTNVNIDGSNCGHQSGNTHSIPDSTKPTTEDIPEQLATSCRSDRKGGPSRGIITVDPPLDSLYPKPNQL
ncbi:hypothetical protein J6590_095574 [Homalodisca vitripennis]|nr:hypothetical protein J6590_095574 [Homalodisca vitripennis]